MPTLSDLHEQIVAAGIPIISLILQQEGNPPTVIVQYGAGATAQNHLEGDALVATWVSLPFQQRQQSKTTEDFLSDEISLSAIVAQLNQAIIDSGVTITLPGTAAAALPVIQTALNAINQRQNGELKLIRFILNRYRPKIS